MVVLARIISDSTIVDISAKGILILVEFLDRFDENLLIVTGKNLFLLQFVENLFSK